MQRDIDVVAATIWGNEVGAQVADMRQSQEHHDQIMKQLRQTQALAYQNRDADASSFALAVERQTSSLAGAIRAQLGETNAFIESGFDQLMWASQQQTQELTRELRRIAEALENPRHIKASELMRDGAMAFEKGVATGNDQWFETARQDLREAVRIRRQDYMAHWHLARLSFEVDGKPDEALHHFEEAATFSEIDNPRLSSIALVWMARILVAKGEYGQAIQKAKKAVAIYPDLGITHFQLARSLAHQYRQEKPPKKSTGPSTTPPSSHAGNLGEVRYQVNHLGEVTAIEEKEGD